MNQREKLQELVDKLKQPDHYDWTAKYVPRKGWYLISEARYWGDQGEYMGYTFNEAQKQIKVFLGK